MAFDTCDIQISVKLIIHARSLARRTQFSQRGVTNVQTEQKRNQTWFKIPFAGLASDDVATSLTLRAFSSPGASQIRRFGWKEMKS